MTEVFSPLLIVGWQFREPANSWTHLVGLLFAVPAALALWRRGGPDLSRRISLLVYGLCLILCYAASTLYHGVMVSSDRLGPFIRLDSVGILALIAGSYTPLAWNLMRGRWRIGTLAIVWGTALTSIVLLASGRRLPSVMGTCLYLGMGWGFVACYAQIAKVVPHRLLFPIVLGGLSYSLGALLNLLDRPVLWAGVFEAHALFHLFVIAGSLCHFWFIWNVVVPFAWDNDSMPQALPGG